jgi:hypothetical protein
MKKENQNPSLANKRTSQKQKIQQMQNNDTLNAS